MRDENMKTAVLWLSLIVGVCNLGAIVWKGGELSHAVKMDSARIERLEQQGSWRLTAFVDVQTEVHKNVELRLAKLEAACLDIQQIHEAVISIQKDMDYLTSRRGTQPTAQVEKQPMGAAW
jgi:hypothetical protein